MILTTNDVNAEQGALVEPLAHRQRRSLPATTGIEQCGSWPLQGGDGTQVIVS